MNGKPPRKISAKWRGLVVLATITALLLSATSAAACPTCKDGIAESDPASQAMAKGYFYSILFMMAMPFVIIGTFGGAAYLSIKWARVEQRSTDDKVSGETTG